MSAPAAMTVSYASLLERVGHHVFGKRSSFSADETTDVENAITDGLRDVYAAHNWSFFRPNKEITTTPPYATGTVTIAAGVVTLSGGTFPSWAAVGVLKVDDDYYEVSTRDGDTQLTLTDTVVAVASASSYELLRLEYDLPTGFESIEGDELTYEPGRSEFYPPVRRRSDVEIRRLLQDDPRQDRPQCFGIRTVEFDPTVGSRRRIAFYPLADAAYLLTARMTLRPTQIDATNQYPVGGEMLGQLILEACLAAAERLYDDGEGVHTKRFQELLPQAIAADQLAASPTSLGPDAPRGENLDYSSRAARVGDLTLNGTVL